MILVGRFFHQYRVFFACFSVMAYLGFHLVSGERGLRALAQMRVEEERLIHKLEKLSEQREDLEAQVELLRPENIDPDMLEERVRVSLNFVHPDEMIIFLSGS